MRLQQSKHQAISMIAAVAGGGMIFAASTAFAEPDMYYLHNGSPYFIWSDLETCEHDLSQSGNSCANWTTRDFGGQLVWSTQATKNVAIDRLDRNDEVRIRHLNGDSTFCVIG